MPPTFEIPERAKQEMRQRPAVNDKGKVLIEFPRGSGIFAAYWPEEREVMRALGDQEREFVHALKAEFDGKILVEPYVHHDG